MHTEPDVDATRRFDRRDRLDRLHVEVVQQLVGVQPTAATGRGLRGNVVGKKMTSHEDLLAEAAEAERIAQARLAELAEAERRRAELKAVPESPTSDK